MDKYQLKSSELKRDQIVDLLKKKKVMVQRSTNGRIFYEIENIKVGHLMAKNLMKVVGLKLVGRCNISSHSLKFYQK